MLPLAVLLLVVVGWQRRHCGQLCRHGRCLATVATHTLFFAFLFIHFSIFLVLSCCRTSPFPPYFFGRRRLQDFVFFQRKHTQNHDGKGSHFFQRKESTFRKNDFANTLMLHIMFVLKVYLVLIVAIH